MAEQIREYIIKDRTIELPKRRKILSVGQHPDHALPVLYVLVDTNSDEGDVEFNIFSNDEDIKEVREQSYVGTHTFTKGPLGGKTYHFFEVTEL